MLIKKIQLLVNIFVIPFVLPIYLSYFSCFEHICHTFRASNIFVILFVLRIYLSYLSCFQYICHTFRASNIFVILFVLRTYFTVNLTNNFNFRILFSFALKNKFCQVHIPFSSRLVIPYNVRSFAPFWRPSRSRRRRRRRRRPQSKQEAP